MARTVAVRPSSHDDALEHVLRTIDMFASHPDITDEEVAAALVRDGVGALDAELLVRFVPSALSFALLKLMGINKFPSSYQVKNGAGGWVELPLASEHYFSAALAVGYEVTSRGYTERVSKEAFQAVITRSAELHAVSKYFESGGTRQELSDAALGPPALLGLTAEQILASRSVQVGKE